MVKLKTESEKKPSAIPRNYPRRREIINKGISTNSESQIVEEIFSLQISLLSKAVIPFIYGKNNMIKYNNINVSCTSFIFLIMQ